MEDKALLSTEVASGAEKAELLIVIPAYNEAENIERVVNHLTANFPQYDYVVVNDGSRDETAAICQRNGYNLLNLPVNLGLAEILGKMEIRRKMGTLRMKMQIRGTVNPMRKTIPVRQILVLRVEMQI